MSCSAYLLGGLIKNKGGVGLFQISQKERLFHVLYQPSYDPPLLHHCTLPKKAFSSPSVCARREYIWKLNWKESLLTYFENCQGAPYSHRQSRNRMMNTFIWVNISYSYMWVRDSWEDKYMFLVHFKKAFSLTLLGHSFYRRTYWLLFHFGNYQGIPLFLHAGQVDRGW